MARTFKTGPYRVKRSRNPVEVHDHRKGYCDLSASPLIDEGRRRINSGGCYWEGQHWRPEFGCHCGMCSAGLREENRRRRYKGKRECQKLTDE